MRIRHLDAENRTHGRLERRAKLELVEARETPVGVHDAVVMVHGEHEAAGEGVAVDPGDSRHGVRQEAAVERPEAGDPVLVADLDGVGQVEAVREKLGQRRRCYDNAGGQAREFDQVEGCEEGLAEGRGEAVVWGRGDRDEVDLGGGLSDGDSAAGVAVTCRDGDCEERFAPWRGRGSHSGVFVIGSLVDK